MLLKTEVLTSIEYFALERVCNPVFIGGQSMHKLQFLAYRKLSETKRKSGITIDDMRKWVKYFQSNAQPKRSGPKKYILPMIPYPSGNLHMGHVRIYTISDILARYYKLKGHNVLHPIGWDAFGLPAENAAIERGVEPSIWTKQNISQMNQQFKKLNIDFDWDRELATCDPNYFQQTQRLFLKLFSAGLAYQANSIVNWDPVDKTVLANEQVDAKGNSWRSGAKVEKKVLKQWYFKTTQYAKKLVENLEQLDWPDSVKYMQRNWIGLKTGLRFQCIVQGKNEPYNCFIGDKNEFKAVKFLAIPAENLDLMMEFMGEQFLDSIDHSMPYSFDTGLMAHLKGETEVAYPLIVSNCISGSTIQAVTPTHENYEKMNRALKSKNVSKSNFDFEKYLTENGRNQVSYNLHDWSVSRQRSWGTPIPIINCNSCGPVAVPDTDLPVKSPNTKDPYPDEWISVPCPKCNSPSKRETDTLDTFVDSSWYFLHFIESSNLDFNFNAQSIKEWFPVNTCLGGIEHATLHLLYARFISHFLYEEGLLPSPEPFSKLITQGMVHGRTFKSSAGKFYSANDVCERNSKFYDTNGIELIESWEKMSKSKYNGIDPNEMIEKYGVDTVRLYVVAKAPVELVLDWNERDIVGQKRWINKLSNLIEQTLSCTEDSKDQSKELAFKRSINESIERINRGFDNTVPSLNVIHRDFIELSYKLRDYKFKSSKSFIEALEKFCIMIFPLAPSVAAEMFSRIPENKDKDIRNQNWPQKFPVKEIDEVEILIMRDGKFLKKIPLASKETNTVAGLRAVLDQMKSKNELDFIGDYETVFIKTEKRIVNFITKKSANANE